MGGFGIFTVEYISDVKFDCLDSAEKHDILQVRSDMKT